MGFQSGGVSPDGITIEQDVSGKFQIKDSGVVVAKIGDNAVETAKIKDDNITLAKLSSGTANHLIGYDGSGDPAEITQFTLYKASLNRVSQITKSSTSWSTIVTENISANGGIIFGARLKADLKTAHAQLGCQVRLKISGTTLGTYYLGLTKNTYDQDFNRSEMEFNKDGTGLAGVALHGGHIANIYETDLIASAFAGIPIVDDTTTLTVEYRGEDGGTAVAVENLNCEVIYSK